MRAEGRRLAPAPAAALLGGLLWVAYGVLELLEPFGVDAAYDAVRGYDVVVHRGLHVLYGLPGAVALGLTASALLALAPRRRRVARVAALLALVAAGTCLAGIVAAFDPLFTGPRVLGTLALGVGTLAAARGAAPELGARRLAVLGVTGIALLALWPLVFAAGLVPAGAAAAVIGSFGLGWAALGRRLLARTARRGPGAPPGRGLRAV